MLFPKSTELPKVSQSSQAAADAGKDPYRAAGLTAPHILLGWLSMELWLCIKVPRFIRSVTASDVVPGCEISVTFKKNQGPQAADVAQVLRADV